MANSIKEGGLRLFKANVAVTLETCVHTASERLGIGDAVKTAGTATATAGYMRTRTVALVASGDPIYGVVQGVLKEMVASGMDLTTRHAASGVTTYVLVRPANHSDEYVITVDGTTADVDIGENINLTGNAGGTTVSQCNATTGMSTLQADTSTHATTATLQLKMIRWDESIGNDPASANASVVVRLNNIENSGGTGVAGV